MINMLVGDLICLLPCSECLKMFEKKSIGKNTEGAPSHGVQVDEWKADLLLSRCLCRPLAGIGGEVRTAIMGF